MTLIASCDKWDLFEENHKAKPCPTVSSEAIPAKVQMAFQHEYPEVNVETWYNKDNNGYVALFAMNSQKKLAYFDNNGKFQQEGFQGEQEGEHQDNDNDDDGCECGIED